MLCLPQACGKHLRRGAEVRAHNDDRRPHASCGACGNKEIYNVLCQHKGFQYTCLSTRCFCLALPVFPSAW